MYINMKEFGFSDRIQNSKFVKKKQYEQKTTVEVKKMFFLLLCVCFK